MQIPFDYTEQYIEEKHISKESTSTQTIILI